MAGPRLSAGPEWADRIEGVYLHVPFCASDCAYCAFAREVPASRDAVRTYLDALALEVRDWRARIGERLAPRTLYIGGGTPTYLTPAEWEEVRETLSGLVDRRALVEFTVEANPESTTPDRLAVLRAFGVTRLSIGAQALERPTLELLGRTHGFDEVREAFARARVHEGLLVSLDLIHGVPGLTIDAWSRTLDAVLDLAPDHLSAYCLGYEEGTSLSRRRARGELPVPSDDLQRRAYDVLVARAEAAGLNRYEVSNFGTPEGRSAHNLAYWEGRAYLGLGPSAHSHVDGHRFRNHTRRPDWEAALGADEGPVVWAERLGPAERRAEALMRLRVTAGVPAELLPAPGGAFHARVEDLREEGLLRWIDTGDGGRRLALTRGAFFVSDAIVADLLLVWEEEAGRAEDAGGRSALGR